MAASPEKHPNSNANKKSCPSLSELSHVEKGEQTHVCTSLKMLAIKTSKGAGSLGCGTAPKLWPRSPVTKIQGLAGTPLSTPPCLPATGVTRGSTTEPQGMEWMSMGAKVSDWDRMLYNLNPLNRRPGHTHTSRCHIPMTWPMGLLRAVWSMLVGNCPCAV